MMKIAKWRIILLALAAVVMSVPVLMAQQDNDIQDSSADRAQSQAQQRAQRRADANVQGQFQIGEEEEEEENRRRR